MLVLDASYPARRLVQLDEKLIDTERLWFESLPDGLTGIKDWSTVTLHQMQMGGGRTTMQGHFREAEFSDRWLSRCIADVIRENDGPVLIVNFKARSGQPDIEGQLKRDLKKHGVDLEAKVRVGDSDVPKFHWLRWGADRSGE